MNEKEKLFRNWELHVRDSESKLREARIKMECGLREAQAVFDQKKATLVREVERAEMELGRDRNCLAEAKANFEKGYE